MTAVFTWGLLSRALTWSAMDFSPLSFIPSARPGLSAATLARFTVASRYCLYFGMLSVVAETAFRSASDCCAWTTAGRESAITARAWVHTRLLRLDITGDSMREEGNFGGAKSSAGEAETKPGTSRALVVPGA